MPLVDMSPEKLFEYQGTPRPAEFDEFWDVSLAELDKARPLRGCLKDISTNNGKIQGQTLVCPFLLWEIIFSSDRLYGNT